MLQITARPGGFIIIQRGSRDTQRDLPGLVPGGPCSTESGNVMHILSQRFLPCRSGVLLQADNEAGAAAGAPHHTLH
ncbi:hypothetical protein EYF80_031867 [Liparis tanakae]|uniref:Uncharacterized protein n=1 Tax=Liparis tanakae TaxID=230148 RepID=A0A4Z2GXB1_9TELE|nr:hypothetical protein EYF80_031867 [Liparis tanakae]